MDHLQIVNLSKKLHKNENFPVKHVRKSSTKNRNLLNGFYKYLKRKRYSKSTIETYSFFIANFIEFNDDRQTQSLTTKDAALFIGKCCRFKVYFRNEKMEQNFLLSRNL